LARGFFLLPESVKMKLIFKFFVCYFHRSVSFLLSF
jgi:hypothetical protein